MTRTIHVAHSPDSDDAFMFYALAEGKIDTGDLRYLHELSDIESLNRRALQAVNGQLRLSQRFAVDFAARLDAEGRTHVGDPDQNASYFNYGQPVLAVGDGKVVEAVSRSRLRTRAETR